MKHPKGNSILKETLSDNHLLLYSVVSKLMKSKFLCTMKKSTALRCFSRNGDRLMNDTGLACFAIGKKR